MTLTPAFLWDPDASPYCRSLIDQLASGHRAAAIQTTELQGRWVQTLTTDSEARATATFERGSAAHVEVVPLLRALDDEAGKLRALAAPSDGLWWQAIAFRIALGGIRICVVGAYDMTGISAALLSTHEVKGRPLGEALTRALLKSRIGGRVARARDAQEAVGDPISVRAVVASAAAEYMFDASAADRGFPLRGHWVSEFDLRAGEWTDGHESTSVHPDAPGSRRRARLNEAILKALEVDAFGTGLDSARAKAPVTSLDEDRISPVVISDDHVVARFELALGADESLLWRYKRDDPKATQTTLAGRLRWGVKKVAEVEKRLRAKAQEFRTGH